MTPSPLLLLLACSLLTGCASMTPPPSRGIPPTPALAQQLSDEGPQRLHWRQSSRKTVPWADTRSTAGDAESGVVRDTSVTEQQNATGTPHAVRTALGEVKGSTHTLADALSKLATRPPSLGNRGLSGANGAFVRHFDYGFNQLLWLRGALGSASMLTDVASQVADSEMELALLRMSGPRLQASMSGAMLLAAWIDFLHLADVVLRECPAYSVEKLIRDMRRVQGLVEPSMAALASADPERVEAAARALPELMGQLTREFLSIREGARVAMERAGQAIAVAQLVEMITMVSAMKLALPRLPPAAPATFGAGLVVSSNGVMMGSQLVVSAEWVEMMRRLVQAGVLSASAVSAAVRIHAGMMMAQAHGDLPKGVRDALGEGPEVRGMHETGKAGAGMAEPPEHHVLPREFREWFEKRGFTGAMSIDQFCVRMERASHEAIHGGGNWKLGRTWPGEWNRMIMTALLDAENKAGRMLTRNEILKNVAKRMRDYQIPMNFIPWRGP
ncbi:MAG TPA: DUF2380 domain-containing protein [Hyalangium sp.]|jgi:hypothetical protein|nr:DUF2380 domain-containing protein [Hyalangium sp.]